VGAATHARVDGLLAGAPRERLAAALNILCTLAEAPGEALASPAAFGGRAEGPSGYEPERINRVLSMIDSRFAEPLRLAELCEAANVSERSLARYFEQHIGESVGRYIARVRIGHACRMLAHTTAPVSVVAARSGFPNVANFNRQFKALKELTPAAYRKQFVAGGIAGTDASPHITERSPSLQRNPRRLKSMV
jgi:AraC-like DNA-binding protein